ncbi:hypothetical protein [Inquilinus sp. OTU3971]|uniref:hypothetical protein n=1 Tax=Inquilinus sp. OTU3971 TaxID=3043855 RepID=UPI00313B0B53
MADEPERRDQRDAPDQTGAAAGPEHGAASATADASASPTTAASIEAVSQLRAEWEQACFLTDVDRRFHLAQERFFAGFRRVNLALTAFASSGAAATYIMGGSSGPGWFGASLSIVAALAAAAELAFAPGNRAREERQAFKAVAELHAQLIADGPPTTDTELREMRAKKARSEADATEPNHVVWLLAYHEACRAIGRPPGENPIHWLRRAVCHLIDLPPPAASESSGQRECLSSSAEQAGLH